jgi:anaerobic magnesium-protoporphyrin IX monomethyl ester cyclase
VHGAAVRLRSPENVLAEIRLLQQHCGCREIVFQDSSLCHNRDWLIALCDALIASGLKLPFSCLARVEQVDEPLLRHMRHAGCWQISFGIESANQHTLDFLGKAATVAQARAAVHAAHAAGIQVRATYLLAPPGETLQDCRRTIALAHELRTHYAAFLITIPFPGTRLYEQASQAGQLAAYNWDDFSLFAPRAFYIDPSVDATALHRLCRRAHLQYYSSPPILMRHLRQLASHLRLAPRYALAAGGLIRTALGC